MAPTRCRHCQQSDLHYTLSLCAPGDDPCMNRLKPEDIANSRFLASQRGCYITGHRDPNMGAPRQPHALIVARKQTRIADLQAALRQGTGNAADAWRRMRG